MQERMILIEENGVDYVSANEMSKIGYKINPFASLNLANKAVFKNDVMTDLLVPVNEIDLNFKKNKL